MIRIFLIITITLSFMFTGCETLRVNRVGVQVEAESENHHHHHDSERWKKEGRYHKKKHHKRRPCPPGHRWRGYHCY